MAATIRRLHARPDRLRAEQATRLRQAVLPFEDEMPDAVREMVAYVARQTASEAGWTFTMISPQQHNAVTEWVLKNSSRPLKAIHLWSVLFTILDHETGEIMMTREQLAGRVGETPGNVSAIMGELEGIGAIIRRRERVPGMRGPGRVRYFMNPVVGTHLGGAARDKAQAEAPPGPLLRIV